MSCTRGKTPFKWEKGVAGKSPMCGVQGSIELDINSSLCFGQNSHMMKYAVLKQFTTSNPSIINFSYFQWISQRGVLQISNPKCYLTRINLHISSVQHAKCKLLPLSTSSCSSSSRKGQRDRKMSKQQLQIPSVYMYMCKFYLSPLKNLAKQAVIGDIVFSCYTPL